MSDTRAGELVIEPVPGENYEGRQWGYLIRMDGRPVLHAWTGGTGPCWNLADPEDEDCSLHVCDLDDLIAAVTFLRSSQEHAANEARWA